MYDRSPVLRPRLAAIPPTVLGLAILVASAWSQPLGAESTEDHQALIDEIQRECLRTYPPEMLRAMTAKTQGEGGTDEIPEAVDAAPENQHEFLTSTIDLDKGLFYPIQLEDLLDTFETYVEPGGRFLDLGSGDGRVVFLAAALGAEATGIEYDKGMVDLSKKALARLGERIDAERVRFIEGDFFKQSWSGYDVIFYFDLTSFEHHELRQKISKELDPGARFLVGHQQGAFPGLALETVFESVHVYRQPNSSMRDASLSDRCKKEAMEAHQFLADWFNAAVGNGEEAFARYGDVLARGFNHVGPDGRLSSRQSHLAQVRQHYGAWRKPGSEEPGNGRIRIENFRIRIVDGPVVLANYEEWHDVDGAHRGTINTVLFRLEHGLPNRVSWFHLHRSEMP